MNNIKLTKLQRNNLNRIMGAILKEDDRGYLANKSQYRYKQEKHKFFYDNYERKLI